MPTFRPASFILLLSTLVVIEAGKVPDLPSGKRLQYYFQTNDGGYQYGYDTGDGSYEKTFTNGNNEVVGEYSYLSPEGPVNVQYSSGVDGFRPEIIKPDGNRQNDGSYTYSYQAEDHSRHESSDGQGNVVGSFSYIPGDGVKRKIIYEAGKGKGFLIKDHSVQIPQHSGYALTNVVNKEIVPITHYNKLGYATVPIIPDFRLQNKQDHHGYGAKNQFISSTTKPWSGNENSDASYAFSYNTNDHSRKENSDSKGNIVGSYSYLSPDGDLKHVEYEAGAEKGFIAKGNHLPQINKQGYSFSYNSDDQTRHETVNGNRNFIAYSFRTPQDIKNIDYTAGTQGFIEHAPKIQENSQHWITNSNTRFTQHPTHTQSQWNYNVRSYLPPNNSHKTGYIYEAQ